MKIFYRCSICGQFFSSEKECCEHEEHGHIKAIKIVEQETNKGAINADDRDGICYPNILRVELSNGKVGQYSLQKVVDPLCEECPF